MATTPKKSRPATTPSTSTASPTGSVGAVSSTSSSRSNINPRRFSAVSRFWKQRSDNVFPKVEAPRQQLDPAPPGSPVRERLCGEAEASPVSWPSKQRLALGEAEASPVSPPSKHRPALGEAEASPVSSPSKQRLALHHPMHTPSRMRTPGSSDRSPPLYSHRGVDIAAASPIRRDEADTGSASSSTFRHWQRDAYSTVSPSQAPVVHTPSTNQSASSRMSQTTSIATPESRATPSGDGDWSAESEMELALEVVNHLPADVADRLIDRLRAAEAARCAAEERCAALIDATQAAASQPEMPSPGKLPAGRGRRRWLSRCLFFTSTLLATASLCGFCTSRFFHWPTIREQVFAALPASTGFSSSSLGVVPLDDLSSGLPAAAAQVIEEATPIVAEEGEPEADSMCQEALLEVQEEVTALNRTRGQLEERYNEVLEAMSGWVGFLRNTPGFFGEKAPVPRHEHEEARHLEDACIEAARPGLNALRQLAPLRKSELKSSECRAEAEDAETLATSRSQQPMQLPDSDLL